MPGVTIDEKAQNNGRVATSSSLTATDGTTPWLSPSGDFAFGFQKIQEKDQFLLCIWYAKIQEKSIIWHANTSDLVPQGSILNLDTQNGLILGDPQGTTLWTTDLVVGNIDYGFMNDTENFVVMRSDSTDPLWESFKNPTDTLLPDQTLERGGFLVSQRSQANFTQDNICVEIDNGGSGACGYNNVCNLGTNNRPVCNCPQEYSLLDPNDAYGDCKPDFSISCDDVGKGSPEDFYSFITIRDTDWPKADSKLIKPSSEQDCQSSCLNDCFCAVAIYRDNSCWQKKLPMTSGRIDTSLNSTAFIKIRKDGVPLPLSLGLPNNPGSRQSKNWQNWAIVLSTLLEIITCRKHYENEESYGLETILTNWVLDCFQEGKLEALVESDIEALNDKKQLERFVMVVFGAFRRIR
ncbi:hypothetical protein K7X08_007773 [Anisodus acutangulus]|uniref:Bulb-type lectin domain-containing protein n=1 Tax=Anisodus acutangulus TaxID=402998 RepID=A0A9Q1MP47_9SOLA|nr:hypothetical protein K7X08_007773 [Anisodus acutangulus]